MRSSMAVLAFSMFLATPVLAQTPAAPAVNATVHPLYAAMPGSTRNEEARKMFAEATARYGMGPVQVMDIPAAPAPRAPELLKTAMAAAEKLKFAEAESALDAAVAEVTS